MSKAGDDLRRLADRADGAGGHAAVKAMTGVAREEIQRRLGLRSHARGTPTPAAPGQPPARISGWLHDSMQEAIPTGGGGVWRSWVGSGVVYARIQHAGGRTGRGHKTYLPPRPYFGVDVIELRLSEASASAFYRATFGR